MFDVCKMYNVDKSLETVLVEQKKLRPLLLLLRRAVLQ